MAEYIEVEALKKQLIEKGFYPVFIKNAIDNSPKVNIVRCKECKRNGGQFGNEVYCDLHLVWFDENAFCSYGGVDNDK